MQYLSKYDMLKSNIRFGFLTMLFIGAMITTGFELSPNTHIDLFCFAGLAGVLLVWVIVDIIQNMISIKKESNYGVPLMQ